MKEAKRKPAGIIYIEANKETRPFDPRQITVKDLVIKITHINTHAFFYRTEILMSKIADCFNEDRRLESEE